ncbi:U6 snRNA phosphodiesterase 1 [Synchiropus splendidus]|uniref:U6 snRNA phosphodiesterase 1 n=1 Tax=Synchiropus splendidus TaxID=270530 RepID=UPI00237DB4BF|nr:U6 snRNA phosphodiesterase 1 [Synchiropus splendidus]
MLSTMLVGYSSSSEEECDATRKERENGAPAKKMKLKETAETKLPLPGCLLSMFPEEVDPQTEDSSLHGGRIRSFKHERGNWATYIYLPYLPDEDFDELLEELLSAASAAGVSLTQQEEFHLSLSQTVVLKHHWIQPFTQSLKVRLARCRRFACSAGRLKVYCNAEKTRTFLGMEVVTGHAQLLDLVQVVDTTMAEFHLETFYSDPSFHVSLAWCVGDETLQLKKCLHRLQSVFDQHEDGAYLMRLDCGELRCRSGNKTFRFSLQR